jgi:hypothetical protein
MLKDTKIRADVLAVHGFLALVLGLAFLYLGATMTNLFFEAVAIVVAFVLSAATLILAGLTDWVAAAGEGWKRAHRLIFYLLAGTALAGTGLALADSSRVTMRWLLVFGAVHGLAFGVATLIFASKLRRHTLERLFFYLFGAASVAFSGVLTYFAGSDIGNPAAAAMLGGYLCFIGAKMLFFALTLYRAVWTATGMGGRTALHTGDGATRPLPIPGDPTPLPRH